MQSLRRPELFVASFAVELHVDGTASELDGAVPELVRRFGEGVVPLLNSRTSPSCGPAPSP